MIPLRDTVRSYTFPIVNWILIGANVIVFLFEISLPSNALERLIAAYGVVPARFNLVHPLALLVNAYPLITLFTHMFLHGGWLHLISNMWVLFIFGDNVEDRMGSGRYLIFYLISGLVAAAAQIAIGPESKIPAVGASGAIAGVLGAYFLLHPKARVITLIPIFIFPWFVEIPAVFFLGFWFLLQLYSGLVALRSPLAASMGGVAWFAHVGGFLFGVLFYRLFTPRRHSAYSRQYPDEYWPW